MIKETKQTCFSVYTHTTDMTDIIRRPPFALLSYPRTGNLAVSIVAKIILCLLTESVLVPFKHAYYLFTDNVGFI